MDESKGGILITKLFLLVKRTGFAIIEKFLDILKKVFLKIFFLSKPNFWSVIIANEVQKLIFSIPGEVKSKYLVTNPLLLWRAKTFFEKEPETIQWIYSLKHGEVFFDIGANVGMYSILAGLKGLSVYSFEPESGNNYYLNRNIIINNLSGTIKAYQFAIGESESIGLLSLTDTQPGAAHTYFGDNAYYKQVHFPVVYEQGCFSTTLDNLVYKYNLPFPSHLKIDVDGIESKIIKGGSRVIEDNRLKTILIEINEGLEEDQWIIDFLLSNNFKIIAQSKGTLSIKDKKSVREYVFERRLKEAF